jgi:FMN phosphatase YigB (HAD superfamily)
MGHGKSAHTAENRRLAARAGQTYLPIFETVVFFDWFGTLSTSRFWDGITQARRHALKRMLSERLHEFFSVERETISLWMRGELTDADVVAHLDIRLPRHYRDDYLHRALHRDCRASAVRPGMAELVRGLRSRALVAVATDNMSCFLAAVPTVLNTEAPVDAILSSAERQVLKAEDPRRFFAPARRDGFRVLACDPDRRLREDMRCVPGARWPRLPVHERVTAARGARTRPCPGGQMGGTPCRVGDRATSHPAQAICGPNRMKAGSRASAGRRMCRIPLN